MSKNITALPTDRKRQHQYSHPAGSGLKAILPRDEQTIVDAYLTGKPAESSAEVQDACDRLGVPHNSRSTRLEAAVGQVLTQNIQHRLPQWYSSRDGKRVLGRQYRARSKGSPIALIPQHLFTINWADSAPGLSWPESYHVVYIPGYHRYVVVTSQDSDDIQGCTDQALGHFLPKERKLVGAKKIITNCWKQQLESYGQEPRAYVLAAGLISEHRAELWRKYVWPKEREEYLC